RLVWSGGGTSGPWSPDEAQPAARRPNSRRVGRVPTFRLRAVTDLGSGLGSLSAVSPYGLEFQPVASAGGAQYQDVIVGRAGPGRFISPRVVSYRGCVSSRRFRIRGCV